MKYKIQIIRKIGPGIGAYELNMELQKILEPPKGRDTTLKMDIFQSKNLPQVPI